MDELEFKKLLIDLGLSISEIARAVGITSWAVTLYFRGTLKNPATRHRIRRVLDQRARQRRIRLPQFWAEHTTV